MTLLSLDNIVRRFGDVEVLTGAKLRVERGDRIGVIGENGAGKTTMIKILAGVDDADEGTRQTARGLRIAYAEQVPERTEGTTVLEFVERGDGHFDELEARIRTLEAQLAEAPDDERALDDYGHLQAAFEAGGGYARANLCERVIGGIGFPVADYDKDVSVLSGGEASRLGLAALMTAPADLLVLDEPTNHLDLEGIAFVEDFVRRHPGAVVVVSHDRRFLDAVATTIVEVEGGTTARFKGDWSAYRRQRDERILAEARAHKNQQEYVAKEMEYIRRNMAGRMSAQAKGRLKRLQRLEFLSRPKRSGAGMKLDFGAGGRGQAGQTMIEAVDVSIRLPNGRVLVDAASFRLLHGETVGVVGRNGTGKTTLMRTLAGLRPPDGGEIHRSHKLEIGYFSQEVRDLPGGGGLTVLEALRALDPTVPDKELRDHLGLFLFSGDRVDTPIDGLSGGEKQRLALARLVRGTYDMLCLDEPTNHLDIAGREGLEEALRGFPGAVLLISHDRGLLEGCSDRILLLHDRRIRRFDGGLAECLRALDAERSEQRAAEAAANARRREDDEAGRKAAAAPAHESGKIRNPMMFRKLEEEIFQLEERLETLRADMTQPENYKDPDRIKALRDEATTVEQRLADAYERWENWS